MLYQAFRTQSTHINNSVRGRVVLRRARIVETAALVSVHSPWQDYRTIRLRHETLPCCQLAGVHPILYHICE
jgi:hypothetical protein